MSNLRISPSLITPALSTQRVQEICSLFDLRNLSFAGGAVHDAIGSLMLCASAPAAYTVVNGRVVVSEGQLASVDLGNVIERHNKFAVQLALGH